MPKSLKFAFSNLSLKNKTLDSEEVKASKTKEETELEITGGLEQENMYLRNLLLIIDTV